MLRVDCAKDSQEANGLRSICPSSQRVPSPTPTEILPSSRGEIWGETSPTALQISNLRLRGPSDFLRGFTGSHLPPSRRRRCPFVTGLVLTAPTGCCRLIILSHSKMSAVSTAFRQPHLGTFTFWFRVKKIAPGECGVQHC